MEKKFNVLYDLVVEEFFKSFKTPYQRLSLEVSPSLTYSTLSEDTLILKTSLRIRAFEEASKEKCFEFYCQMQSECKLEGDFSNDLHDWLAETGINHYAVIRSRLRSKSLMTISPVLNIPVINITQLKNTLLKED